MTIEDTGAHLLRQQRRHRLVVAAAILAAGMAAAALTSCAGLQAKVAVGKPDVMAPPTGGYAAKTWRVVVIARNGEEAPVPVAGVELVLWDSSAMVRRTATTGPDGSAAFVCRCEPQFYLGGRRLDAAAAPDDVLPNVWNVLAEVTP